MRPSQARLEIVHIVVSQRLRPINSYRADGDNASGRVEPVHIEAQEQAIPGTGLVVQPGGNHQIVFLPWLDPKIGGQRVQSIRHLLKVYGIGRVRRAVVARYWVGSVGRR